MANRTTYNNCISNFQLANTFETTTSRTASLLLSVFTAWMSVCTQSRDEHRAELQRAVDAAAVWRARFSGHQKLEQLRSKFQECSDAETPGSTTAEESNSGASSSSEDEQFEQGPGQKPEPKNPAPPLCAHMRGRLSGLLSKVLRHTASSWGLNIGTDGFVRVDDLLTLPPFQEIDAKSRDVMYVVEWERTTKQRFSLRSGPEGLFIRANQGHSDSAVKGCSVTRPVEAADLPPCVLHGTYTRHLRTILTEGLRPMARHHIHLFVEEAGVGRRNAEVLIHVNVARARAAGVEFMLSENGVVLSTGGVGGAIPPTCFQRIVRVRDGALLHESQDAANAKLRLKESIACLSAALLPPWDAAKHADVNVDTVTKSQGRYVPPHRRTQNVKRVPQAGKYIPPSRRAQSW